jgi:hypothetical protein
MSVLFSHLFNNSIIPDNQSTDIPKSKKLYDKSMYITIVNKSYKDILLTPDELSFLETIPPKKLGIIVNINRNNRLYDKTS